MDDRLAEISPATVHKQVSEFLATRLKVLRYVRDALADSQYKQKERADAKGRGLAMMSSETKCYSILKSTSECSVCRLQDKVASALHWTIYCRR